MSFEFVEGVVDGDEFFHAVVGDEKVFAQFFPRTSSVAFEPLSGAGALDKDAAHGLGGSGEEVATTIELLVEDQPQIRLVNQRSGLERLAGFLVGEPGCSEVAEFIVDEREQLGGSGVRFALLDQIQNPRDFSHAKIVTRSPACIDHEVGSVVAASPIQH